MPQTVVVYGAYQVGSFVSTKVVELYAPDDSPPEDDSTLAGICRNLGFIMAQGDTATKSLIVCNLLCLQNQIGASTRGFGMYHIPATLILIYLIPFTAKMKYFKTQKFLAWPLLMATGIYWSTHAKSFSWTR